MNQIKMGKIKFFIFIVFFNNISAEQYLENDFGKNIILGLNYTKETYFDYPQDKINMDFLSFIMLKLFSNQQIKDTVEIATFARDILKGANKIILEKTVKIIHLQEKEKRKVAKQKNNEKTTCNNEEYDQDAMKDAFQNALKESIKLSDNFTKPLETEDIININPANLKQIKIMANNLSDIDDATKYQFTWPDDEDEQIILIKFLIITINTKIYPSTKKFITKFMNNVVSYNEYIIYPSTSSILQIMHYISNNLDNMQYFELEIDTPSFAQLIE